MSAFAAPKTRRPCRSRAARGRRAGPLAFRAAGDEGIDHAGHGAAEDRGNPEEPELGEGPPIREDGSPSAARGVEERFVTGMPTKLISVTARPIAMGAKP